MKKVLLVDDEARVLQGLQRQLRPLRKEWTVLTADGGGAALQILRTEHVDLVITDMRMPGMDGAELLAECKRLYPTTIRMVLSGQMEEDAALRSIAVAQRAFSKPCDAKELRHVLKRVAELSDILDNEDVRSTLGEIDSLPILPESYDLLSRAIDDPSISVADLVPVVERDPMLTAKILQIVNSAVVGLRTDISEISRALGIIGLRHLRALVLHHAIVQGMQFDRLPYGFNLDKISRMSLWTAALARRIAPDAVRDNAFAAGLLKDTGLILLALRRPEDFARVSEACDASDVPRHRLEEEVLGFTSAQVGAYLLGMWGLPHDLLLAVLHHRDVDAEDLPNEPATVALHVATSILEDMMPAWPGRGASLHLEKEGLTALSWDAQMEEWTRIAKDIVEGETVHA